MIHRTTTRSTLFALTLLFALLCSPAAFANVCDGATTPEQDIEALVALVDSLGLSNGLSTSLTVSLEAALDSLAAGNPGAAGNQLGAFVNKVEAQAGKKISQPDAELLLAGAQAVIGCLPGSIWTVCADGSADFELIQDAVNASVPGDRITICAGVHTEAGILIDRDLVLMGAGQDSTIVQAASSAALATERVFEVTTTSQLRDMTIRHGNALAEDPPRGGGVFVPFSGDRKLTVANCTVTENQARTGGGIMGGEELNVFSSIVSNNSATQTASGMFCGRNCTFVDIYVTANVGPGVGGILVSGQATMTLRDSTISGNVSDSALTPDPRTNTHGFGAGLAAIGAPPATPTVNVVNTTISGNTASERGAGISLTSKANLTLVHSTVTDNHAGPKGGGGLRAQGGAGAVSVNSIIAGNTATSGAPDCDVRGKGAKAAWTALGANLTSHSGCLSFSTVTSDAGLGPLADNSGATPTHLPSASSAAIDTADAGFCADIGSVDQRGEARPAGAGCDLGSVERQ
jgi:parallel beta-helix repeat protein